MFMLHLPLAVLDNAMMQDWITGRDLSAER